jgi:hypothetical protein
MKCRVFFFPSLQIEQRKASKAPKNRFSKRTHFSGVKNNQVNTVTVVNNGESVIWRRRHYLFTVAETGRGIIYVGVFFDVYNGSKTSRFVKVGQVVRRNQYMWRTTESKMRTRMTVQGH